MKIKIILLSIVLLLFVNCSDDNVSSSDNDSYPNTFTYDVNLTENTVYLDSSFTDLLISHEDNLFTFQNDASLDHLEEGQILMVHGKGLGEITSISRNREEIAIRTKYCKLNKAIADGTIAWDRACGFDENTEAFVVEGDKLIPFKRLGKDTLSYELKVNSYIYSVKMVYHKSYAALVLTIKKEFMDNIVAKYECSGVIEQIVSQNKLVYENSEVKTFNHQNKNLKGVLELSLTAAGSKTDAINFKLPVILFKYPFLVGPIPMSMNAKVQLVVNAVVPLEGSSRVSATFKYDSRTGFKYNGLSYGSDASSGDYSIKKGVHETGAASAISVNFGLGFPRLELECFGNTIVPWVQTAFLIGGSYTFYPAHQDARAMFIGAGGFKASFLGIEKEWTKEFWKKEKILFTTDGDGKNQDDGFRKCYQLLSEEPDERLK